ncbi:MAG: AAA family ATPase, partial [Spirochaetales bacterium]|nr:AAA family ATPase [Spirochaetales bacterium]
MSIHAYEVDPADIAFGITDSEIAAFDAEKPEDGGGESPASIIGQERAVRAIGLGMGIRAKGYNIYVTGLPGTGKRTAITKILDVRAAQARALCDLAYVNNFRQPDSPLILRFEAGRGGVFKQALERLVDNLKKALSRRKTPAAAAPAIQAEVKALRGEFSGPKVSGYLAALEEDLAQNFHLFTESFSDDPSVEPPAYRYGVNLIVDNRAGKPPVIFETFPDHAAIFGNQEPAGEGRSHFMLLRAGSLIRASGGFLILRAEDLLNEEDAWNSLKRALEDGRTEIRNPPNPFYSVPSPLKPEAVEIDTKIILLGNENTYDYLYNADDDFPKLFKVHAEFDSVMDRDKRGVREYINFIRRLTAEEALPDFDYSGLAAVLEYGVRVGEFRSKLTTRFSLIAGLIREAGYWASLAGGKTVNRAMVARALDERRFLHNLPEAKIDEQILSGELLLSLRGKAVGRINGLGIIDRG